MAANQENIEAKLCAYIEGDIDDAGRAEIEKHLASNPQHRTLLDSLVQQRDLLRALPREKAPVDIYETLQGQLERSVLLGAGDDDLGAESIRIGQWTQWRAIAAVLLLTIGLAVVVYVILPTTRPSVEIAANLPKPDSGPVFDEGAFFRDGEHAGAESMEKGGFASRSSPDAGKAIPSPHDSASKGGTDLPAGAVQPPAAKSGAPADGQVAQQVVMSDSLALDPRLAEQLRQNGVEGNYTCVVVASADPVQTTAQVAGYLTDNRIPWEPVNTPISGLVRGGPGAPDQAASQTPTPAPTDPRQFDGQTTGKQKEDVPPVLSQLAMGTDNDQLRAAASERLIVARNMTRSQTVGLNDALNTPAPQWQNARLVDPADASQTRHSVENMARPDRETRKSAGQTEAQPGPSTAPSSDMSQTPIPEDLRLETARTDQAEPPTTRPTKPFAPGDDLVITIPDLKGPGFEVRNPVKVAPDGTVDLPMIDPVQCVGLTGGELEESIRDRYRRSKLAPEVEVRVEVPTTQPQVAQTLRPQEEPRVDVVIWVRAPLPNERTTQQSAEQLPGQVAEPPSTRPADPAGGVQQK